MRKVTSSRAKGSIKGRKVISSHFLKRRTIQPHRRWSSTTTSMTTLSLLSLVGIGVHFCVADLSFSHSLSLTLSLSLLCPLSALGLLSCFPCNGKRRAKKLIAPQAWRQCEHLVNSNSNLFYIVFIVLCCINKCSFQNNQSISRGICVCDDTGTKNRSYPKSNGQRSKSS